MSSSNRIAVFGLIFFCSGFSSLIYQIAWQRLFTLYYGVGPSWITLTVSVYMAGLGIGSLVGGRLSEGKRDNILLYCGVEFFLGAFGYCSVLLLQTLGQHTAGSGFLACLAYTSGFLLIPTFLMGMTLPILTKVLSAVQPDISLIVARLYCLNTLGAALGSLAASFVLISFFGVDIAIYCAASINLLMAGVVWKLGQISNPETLSSPGSTFLPESDRSLRRGVYWIPVLAFVTGFLAIGYEIVWVRLVAVLVKDSPYAFSSILFVYLLGVAIGSFILEWVLRRFQWHRGHLLLLLQGLIGLYSLTSVTLYYALTKYTSLAWITEASFLFPRHPHLPGGSFTGLELWVCLDIFLWPAYFILVPTILMGASFPLMADLILKRSERQGEAVARAYFMMILGNVSGGFVTGFGLLPLLGTEHCLLTFGLIQVLALTLIGKSPQGMPSLNRLASVRFALVAVVASLALGFFPGPGELYLVMHRGKELSKKGAVYLAEGVDGVVVTYVLRDAVLNYINGQSHGGRPIYIFHALAIEALRVPKRTRRALLIGYGTGSFLETVLKLKDLEKVTVVELNQTLLDNLSKIPLFEPLLNDPRIEIVHDDGRRYLLNSQEKFDFVCLDPLRTTTAYSNNLYSRDFFELVRRHMGAESAFLVWHDQARVIPATLFSVFPETLQYARFLVSSPDPIVMHEDRRQQLLDSFPESARKKIESARLDPLPNEAPEGYINTDYRPVAEYYCGLPFREFLSRHGL